MFSLSKMFYILEIIKITIISKILKTLCILNNEIVFNSHNLNINLKNNKMFRM